MAFFKLNGIPSIGIGSDTFDADASGVVEIPDESVASLFALLPLLPAGSVESADAPADADTRPKRGRKPATVVETVVESADALPEAE